jgi:hypothetical protein
MRSMLALLIGTLLTVRAAASDYQSLVDLAQDWRGFAAPEIHDCLPDYDQAAIGRKASGLKRFRTRLAAIGRKGWTVAQEDDYRLIEAEMNGLDFDLRVLRPWARDPSFYATIKGEQSDVPAHEGPTAEPVIDLFAYAYPLSPQDQKTLSCRIGAIPALLAAAKARLKDGNEADLWRYGGRAFREQAETLAALEAGTLSMRTLEGTVHGTLSGADPALAAAVEKARAATDDFARWIAAEAPHKTGPSGVGKANYDWYERNVHLVPLSWEEQKTLLQRELDRAQAGLRVEELRNRAMPPQDPAPDEAAFDAVAAAKMARITDFLIGTGVVPDRPYYRAAMAQQVGGWPPPDQRNFFDHTMVRDPLGLDSHKYHWIELARLKHEPNDSPIRRLPILYNMFDSRSEGLATAMEEWLMQAGLYDDDQRGREIVWIMLANRAARGLAALRVQANEITLDEAGRFHARWTPRGWSDAASDLVGFEQLLYLRQPGYGTSYITGKLGFEHLIAAAAHRAEEKGEPFDFPSFFARFNQAGIIPFALIEREMVE